MKPYNIIMATFKTDKVTEATAILVLQLHVDRSHPAAVQAGPVQEARPQAERVKRPSLTLTG